MASMALMPSPKFEGYNDNPNGMLTLLIVGMVMPLVLLVLRLVARKVERVGYWWDDGLAVLSTVGPSFLYILLLPRGQPVCSMHLI